MATRHRSRSSRNGGEQPVIVWFRDDLRTADNPALDHAARTGAPVLPVYVLDESSPGVRAHGAAQKWMLHQALHALGRRLAEAGLKLAVLRGPAAEVIADLADACDAGRICWNRRYAGAEAEVDRSTARRLEQDGRATAVFNASLMHDPSHLLTTEGRPYRVYSPFWRAFAGQGEPRRPVDAPRRVAACSVPDGNLPLDALQLRPTKPDWAAGLRESWEAGEAGAHDKLADFARRGLAGYGEGRDMPAGDHVSRLSPYLRFGMISPFQAWHGVAGTGAPEEDVVKFRKELVWREFCYHLLHHFPEIVDRNHDRRFDAFPWRRSPAAIRAWQRGRTGYPVVDAGMRQLWRTGYMHNRVRMIAASFLTKHLLVDWREGEKWFWDTLVDGDPASNPANWQWVAGSGADAAPYFRIFNPVLQGRRFDPDGAYVRRWLPEIASLDVRYLHEPWKAPPEALASAGISLGRTYPGPMVDHAEARRRALHAFESIRKGGQ